MRSVLYLLVKEFLNAILLIWTQDVFSKQMSHYEMCRIVQYIQYTPTSIQKEAEMTLETAFLGL